MLQVLPTIFRINGWLAGSCSKQDGALSLAINFGTGVGDYQSYPCSRFIFLDCGAAMVSPMNPFEPQQARLHQAEHVSACNRYLATYGIFFVQPSRSCAALNRQGL